jgi:hypothetical protein
MDSLTTFRRTVTVVALALAVGAVVVPSAAANGDDGDRATSKPIVVASAPQGFGSMGDRATSKSVYGPVDNWYRYAVSKGNSVPVSATVPPVQVVSSDGFSWTGFAIGAAAMLGAFALLGAVGLGLRGARSGHTLRST